MTKAEIERYFRLKFELVERGRLDPESKEPVRQREYERLEDQWDDLEMEEEEEESRDCDHCETRLPVGKTSGWSTYTARNGVTRWWCQRKPCLIAFQEFIDSI